MMTYPTPIDSNSTLENGGGVPTPKNPFWDNSPYELLFRRLHFKTWNSVMVLYEKIKPTITVPHFE
jgi:hypothetical protein